MSGVRESILEYYLPLLRFTYVQAQVTFCVKKDASVAEYGKVYIKSIER